MATNSIVGHWANLGEAQKLTQDMLLRGVVQETIETGFLTKMFPVTGVLGKQLTYNRESALSSGRFFDIHEQRVWEASNTYSQVSVELKRVGHDALIDNFIAKTYANVNDYEAIKMKEVVKGTIRTVENEMVYGDVDNISAKGFDGLHALASAQSGNLNIDGAETAISLQDLRKMMIAAKVPQLGKSSCFWLCGREIGRRMSAYVQEAGQAVSNGFLSGIFTMGVDQFGMQIQQFAGIPIVETDFLVAEQLNTGLTTATSRDKRTSGTNGYSLFLIRAGSLEEGGVSMLMGTSGGIEGLFNVEFFDKLETVKDARGVSLTAYMALAQGSTNSIARLADVTDAAITA